MSVERLHGAEVGFPYQLTSEVEAIESERAKEDKQVLAVGHRSVRRQARGVMPLFIRQGFAESFLPENLAT